MVVECKCGPCDVISTAAALTLRSEGTERMAENHITIHRTGRLKGSRNGVATPNPYRTEGKVGFLDLGNGVESVIDHSDYQLVKQYRWNSHFEKFGNVYAVSNGIKGKLPATTLHRLVMGHPPSDVDHKDRDGLNCRRLNLRAATRTQNNANKVSKIGSTSRFKGVTWDRARGKWKALIGVSGKMINLGRFNEEFDAATAYNFAAEEAFGEFARLNVI